MLESRHRRVITLLAAASSVLAIAGCGAQVAKDGKTSTATVERCGEKVEYQTPERAVVYEGGSADKMFALGLTKHVHGYVMPPANPPVSQSPWASEYKKVEYLGDDLLNKELVVDAKSDFVVAGWNSGFSDDRGVTPEILDDLGVQSFMHTESCFNYPKYPQAVKPLPGLYTDLERLGEIFGVEDKAKKLVADYKDRVAAVDDKAPEGEAIPTFLYDSGTDQPFTAGNQVPPNDIIAHAGGRNIFADVDERWTQVGWEAVVEAEPEVIIILDYGDKPAKDKIDFLKSSRVTRDLPAVKNDRFFVLDYNEGISSPRSIDGMEKFGRYLADEFPR